MSSILPSITSSIHPQAGRQADGRDGSNTLSTEEEAREASWVRVGPIPLLSSLLSLRCLGSPHLILLRLSSLLAFLLPSLVVMAGTALHAHQTCQLASFHGLRPSSARVTPLNPSHVSLPIRTGSSAIKANSPNAAGSSGDAAASAPSPPAKKSSIMCQSCDGNGAVSCSQCHGAGLNTEDHFNGRFKAGTTCWLCRGKRQMLCGNCNGAGFMGGFMNTQDE